MTATVVSVLNMKGGVGKTNITLNLAYSLAKFKNCRVLVIDFDPQANASSALMTYTDYEQHRDTKKVISDIFSDLEMIVGPVTKKNINLISLKDMICRARAFDGGGFIDLVPSELELSNVLERAGGRSIEERLQLILKDKKDKYNFVLVDCGPTYSVLTNNALRASDFVLIPVKPDPFSSRGIPMLMSKIEAHNRASKEEDKVKILGIVFSMVKDRTAYANSVKAEIYREHTNVFKNEIRYTEFYPRAIVDNKSIFETNAQLPFKNNFKSFAEEFLEKVEKERMATV